MLKTQYVLFNHSSPVWCLAQGAPAPFIVWKKNGIVVQNSTSVMFQPNIIEENNDNYSCEVNRRDGFDKKEIHLVMEREFFNILTLIHAFNFLFITFNYSRVNYLATKAICMTLLDYALVYKYNIYKKELTLRLTHS